MEKDIFFMQQALDEAAKAAALDEVPVGAIIVKDEVVIARGYNQKESGKDATLHAEIIAIREACRALNSWRLLDCCIYVTLEPCAMCAGAMVQARIGRLVYGAADPKTGAAGSLLDLVRFKPFNHQIQVESGVLEEKAVVLLRDFFRRKRQK
ncbi:MAG: tRNA adenosine(34) deaminase TadA [Bacillota bacterium]|jgi:tRNA(adenine34) deaminase